MRKLDFVHMNWTDNVDLACQNDQILNGLGSIVVKFYRGTIGAKSRKPRYSTGPVDQSPIYTGFKARLGMLTERAA